MKDHQHSSVPADSAVEEHVESERVRQPMGNAAAQDQMGRQVHEDTRTGDRWRARLHGFPCGEASLDGAHLDYLRGWLDDAEDHVQGGRASGFSVVEAVGHASREGEGSDNYRLSGERALAVLDELGNGGVMKARGEAEGAGASSADYP